MADGVVGTVAPATFAIPPWLQAWEQPIGPQQFLHLLPKFAATDPAPASYQKIEAFNFKFLGKEFESAQYVGYDRNPNGADAANRKIVQGPFTVTGVCAELRAFLLAAQRDIFQGFAGRQAQRGQPVTEQGFIDYCAVAGQHKGFQPRDGKHKRGAAIDIDPKFNPYTVTGAIVPSPTPPPPLGGETPSNFRTGGNIPVNSNVLNLLRRDAATAYANACNFTFGSPNLDVSSRDPNARPRDPADATFERFDRVNRALRLYMNCGFVPFGTNDKIPKNAVVTPRPLNDIAKAITEFNQFGFFAGGTAPGQVNNQAFLQAFQTQVAIDHRAMRLVCIYDSWTIVNGVQNFGASRDPCFGIMLLRKHVVKGLLEVQINGVALRWGALHFGTSESGDMMHFDLGGLADNIQTTSEPNTSGVFLAP